MLDKTVQRMPQAPAYECAKGCNFCCHTAVSVSAPEVFRIVHLIEGEPDQAGLDRDGVIARAKARVGTTIEATMPPSVASTMTARARRARVAAARSRPR